MSMIYEFVQKHNLKKKNQKTKESKKQINKIWKNKY